MAENAGEPSTLGMDVPYPPSWIDRLISWIDRLPGPAWLTYALSVIGFAVLINALFWLDGALPFGSIYATGTGFSIFVVYWLGLYHYLTGVGSRSLQTFRPLLEADDAEIKRIDYQLATLPGWLGWLAIPLGLVFAAATILTDPAPYEELVPRTAAPFVGDIAITGFLVATFYCLIIRSIRQLRMVRRLLARATNFNLLDLAPAHAFSALTSRTGIGMILVLVFSYLLDPVTASSSVDAFGTVTTLSIAIAVFVLPVIGIRDQLEEEKQRVLERASGLLQATIEGFHDRVESEDYRDLKGMETAIATLIRERELYARISTWPWDAGTIRGFASTLLLPIFLLLVGRLLERFL